MERIFLIFAVCTGVFSQSKVSQSDDGSSGTISFSTPDLSDEESYSPFMPSQLKCDACRIIAYQLHEKFEKFNIQHKSLKYNIRESDLLDLTEDVCQSSTFENYGLIESQKVKRLKGPGLDTADTPGVMQGGGKWPRRLLDMCGTYTGDIGEWEIYQVYKEKPKSIKQFEKFLCYGDDILGECSKLSKKDEL